MFCGEFQSKRIRNFCKENQNLRNRKGEYQNEHSFHSAYIEILNDFVLLTSNISIHFEIFFKKYI